MKGALSKFKIPTILGLGIITVGIISGVVLTLQEQILTSRASPDVSAQNITLSNITESEVTISWQTSIPIPSFITFGQTNPNEQVVLDDRDTNPAPDDARPQAYATHYATIKNLLPKTTYQYKIVTGKLSSETDEFTTAVPLAQQTGFRPVIGSVLDGEKPLDEGIAYLAIAGATALSAPVKPSGNFLIPLSQIRNSDLSDSFPITEDTTAKLTVMSASGNVSALFKIMSYESLPPLKLGQYIDLTSEASPVPQTALSELDVYDLNEDGKINAADNAIILQNIGNPVPYGTGPKNEQSSAAYKKADLNGDQTVDQKDLDLMAQQINQ